jgi:hypothetical protein
MTLLRPHNRLYLLAVSPRVGAGFTGDPRLRRGRPSGPGSPKGFGSYRISGQRLAADGTGDPRADQELRAIAWSRDNPW